MLVRTVVGHEIQNDPKAPRMRLGDQPVEIRKTAKDRGYIAIICNVISKIRHGRRINWRNPNRVDAKTHNMVKALNNSWEIANSIAVGILKRPRINLIDDATLPPRQFLHAPGPQISSPN